MKDLKTLQDIQYNNLSTKFCSLQESIDAIYSAKYAETEGEIKEEVLKD